MAAPNTLILTNCDCSSHAVDIEHPEKPSRLSVVVAAIRALKKKNIIWQESSPARDDDIRLTHDLDMIASIWASIPSKGFWNIEADTMLCPTSERAIRAAAGAPRDAIAAILDGQAVNAFCAIRPPGHHAERAKAMGFCFFNNLALGAQWALENGVARRIAIVDFDAHHGNGQQNIFWSSSSVLICSTHIWPSEIITGGTDERGLFDQVVNVPLPRRCGSDAFRSAFLKFILPRLESFRPDLILVAAGFDGHVADPVGNLALQTADFAWLGRTLTGAARRLCGGRLVASLEGGYDSQALAEATQAFVAALADAAASHAPSFSHAS